MNLLLIRHGETSWNLEQRYQGSRTAPSLSWALRKQKNRPFLLV